MIRELSFFELKRETLLCEAPECHRQMWRKHRAWLGYRETPRFADGLMLVCSDIHVRVTCSDGRVLTAKKGDMVYVPKGSCYTVTFSGGGNEPNLYTVNFCLRDREGCELRLGREITVTEGIVTSEIRRLSSRMADAYLRPEVNCLKLQTCFFALLDAIVDALGEGNTAYASIRAGIDLLSEEWNQNKKMEYYAVACGISESSFYQHFKAWSGVSPNEYRTGLRMAAAKSMLRNSNLSVLEIALHVGFDDPYYFSRLFKKCVGVSPRVYRSKAEPIKRL